MKLFRSTYELCYFLFKVNLDSVTRGFTIDALSKPDVNTFDQAQYRIQSLMAKDSYPRFLRSDVYLDLLK